MSKKTTQQKSKTSAATNNKLLVPAVLVAVVMIAVIGALILTNRPAASDPGQATGSTGAAAIPDISDGLITPQEYQTVFGSTDHVLIDVRTIEEFNSGHIADAGNIPVEVIAGRLSEIPQDEPVVLYCRSGNRSAQAASILRQAGYTQVYDLGGIISWQQAGLPVVQ